MDNLIKKDKLTDTEKYIAFIANNAMIPLLNVESHPNALIEISNDLQIKTFIGKDDQEIMTHDLTIDLYKNDALLLTITQIIGDNFDIFVEVDIITALAYYKKLLSGTYNAEEFNVQYYEEIDQDTSAIIKGKALEELYILLKRLEKRDYLIDKSIKHWQRQRKLDEQTAKEHERQEMISEISLGYRYRHFM